jgi:hemerythrin superfamily protein
MAKDSQKGVRSGKTSSKQSDAVQMLKADHRMVKELFEQYHSASANEKIHIAGRLFTELTLHASLEEELFYPAVESKFEPADALESPAEGNGLDMLEEEEEIQDLEAEGIDGMELQADEEKGDEIIAQAYEDHQMVKEFIEQLKTLDPQGSDYQEVFTELENAVLEHITDEEDVIFPVAASQLDIKKLGAAMQQRRDDMSSSAA